MRIAGIVHPAKECKTCMGHACMWGKHPDALARRCVLERISVVGKRMFRRCFRLKARIEQESDIGCDTCVSSERRSRGLVSIRSKPGNLLNPVTMESDGIVQFDESKLGNDFRTTPSVGGDDESGPSRSASLYGRGGARSAVARKTI